MRRLRAGSILLVLLIPSLVVGAIHNIQVSNHTNSAVTISWITENPSPGVVHYSTDAGLLNPSTAGDVRDTDEQLYEGITHYVNLYNLQKETTYYFEVISGDDLDDNGGNYHTFRTMKEPYAPPGICLLYGHVYSPGDMAPAEGAILFLRMTHKGVVSYPLSRLIGGDASFLFNMKEARSSVTDGLFSAIISGDPIHLEVTYYADSAVDTDFTYTGCTFNCGSLVLPLPLSSSTTTSSIPSGVTTTTTSIPDTPPPPTTTTTTLPGSETSSTSSTSTTPSSTTTIPLSTTTSIVPLVQCVVSVVIPSSHVVPRERLPLSAQTHCDGKVSEGEYSWFINTTIGSRIDSNNGVYKAGGIAGTDTITVIDTLNGNCITTVEITVSPLWPMAYDEMWGEKKGDYLSLLRSFRDGVLTKSATGKEYIFMLYSHSMEIVILLLTNQALIDETKTVVDELLPVIASSLSGGGISLSEEQIARIDSLVSNVRVKATPQLSGALEKVQLDLKDKMLFKRLSVPEIKKQKLPVRILPSYTLHP